MQDGALLRRKKKKGSDEAELPAAVRAGILRGRLCRLNM
jgi:hypothetical protein